MQKRLLLGYVVAFAVLASFGAGAGCSYDWTYAEPAADAGRDGTAPSDSGDEPPKPDPPLPVTECKVGSDCPPETFCRFEDGHCGRQGFETTGQCVEQDTVCAANTPVVSTCACNGETVRSACEAARRFSDIDVDGVACLKRPPFDCASAESCVAGLQYCYVRESAPKVAQCREFVKCDVPSKCTCTDVAEPGGCECTQNGDTITVRCPAI